MLLMAVSALPAGVSAPGGGTAIHRRQDEGPRKTRRLRAALLEPGRRHAVAGDSGARHRDALPDVAVGRPRLERHRPRSRPARRHLHRPVPARRQEGAAGRSRTTRSAPSARAPTSGAPSTKRSRRSVLWGFEVGAETGGRVLVDATKFVLRDVHDVAAAPEAGQLQPRRVAQRGEPRSHQGVPAQHRDGRAPDVHQQRRARRRDRRRPAGGRVTDVAPTARAVTVQQHHSFDQAARAGLRAAAVRSPRRRLRDVVHGLRRADDRAAGHADDRPASSAQAGSGRGGQRRRCSRSSTTSIAARRSRSARPCSTAPAGGTRLSRRPATATPSASS